MKNIKLLKLIKEFKKFFFKDIFNFHLRKIKRPDWLYDFSIQTKTLKSKKCLTRELTEKKVILKDSVFYESEIDFVLTYSPRFDSDERLFALIWFLNNTSKIIEANISIIKDVFYKNATKLQIGTSAIQCNFIILHKKK